MQGTAVPGGVVRRTVAVGLGVLLASALGPAPATGTATAGSDPVPMPDGVELVAVADMALSADGRWAVYAAEAREGEAEPRPGLFLADRRTGTATRLDVEAGARIAEVDVSDDATRIAYRVGERDVVPGQDPAQIHLHDRSAGTTTLVSAADGSAGEAASFDPQVSADGTVVAFTTEARRLLDLPAGDAWVSGVVATEVGTGELEVLSGPGGRASDPALSGDGRLVAYSTDDPAVPGDGDTDTDVVVHDRTSGEQVLVTTGEGGGFAPVLSADGSTVAWSRVVATRKPGVSFHGTWATDLTTGTTSRVDVDAEGVGIQSLVADAVVSADGRRVLLAGLDRDGPALQALYVHDLDVGTTGIVPTADGPPGQQPITATDLSADGRVAGYAHGFPGDRTLWTHEIGALLPVPPAPPEEEPVEEVVRNTRAPQVGRVPTFTSYAFTLEQAGEWVSNVPLEYRYQWLRDGEQATDNVGTTYEVGPEDIGHVISLREVVVGPGGTLVAVESAGVVARRASSRLRVKVERPRGRSGPVVVRVRLSHHWGVRSQGRVVVRLGGQVRRVATDAAGVARVRLRVAPGRRVLRVRHRGTPVVGRAAAVRRVVRVTR